jgi:alpha-D-ribose 1-methylphosphonate 5-triphosphate synthase subunit PhnG
MKSSSGRCLPPLTRGLNLIEARAGKGGGARTEQAGKLTVTAAHAGKELQRLAVVGWWWQLPRSKQGASQQRQLAVVVQARGRCCVQGLRFLEVSSLQQGDL